MECQVKRSEVKDNKVSTEVAEQAGSSRVQIGWPVNWLSPTQAINITGLNKLGCKRSGLQQVGLLFILTKTNWIVTLLEAEHFCLGTVENRKWIIHSD